jgi:hypothetical protein
MIRYLSRMSRIFPTSVFHACCLALSILYTYVAKPYWQHIKAPRRPSNFQKILDNRGVVGSDPIGVLAHLQLGRALVLSGDRTKGKSCLRRFP